MQSSAPTVAAYLASLPEDRRAAISAVREVVLAHLDSEYEEGMNYGMIGYYVPHRVYPPGYHCDPKQPLPFACLASQKNYMSLYLMCEYFDAENAGPEAQWFRGRWAKSGKKLDMGKSCIRFRKVEDLALDVIGEALDRMPARTFIAQYEAARARTKTAGAKQAAAKKAAAKKVAAKKVAAKKVAAKKAPAPKALPAKKRKV